MFAAKAALGRNLQMARMAAGMTQMALAEAAGIARATVTQLESATGDPCLSTLVKLAEVLKVSPMLLLMQENELRGFQELLGKKELPQNMLTPEQAKRAGMMLATGIDRQKNDATKQISAAANLIGLSGVGAAIGAGLLPMAGGILGAALGYWLNSGNEPKPEDQPTRGKKSGS